MIPQAARINRRATTRQSSDTCWPLRGVDGLTYAERARADAGAMADARMTYAIPAATSPVARDRTRNPHPSAVEVGAGATGKR